MKRNRTPQLHCPTLVGPTDRLWLDLLAEAKAAGADLNAGEAAFLLTHDHDDDIPASSSGASTRKERTMTGTITLDTPLGDIARAYDSTIYDSLDAIGDDLIDTDAVGQDWGWALDRVVREHGDDATVRHLRDELAQRRED